MFKYLRDNADVPDGVSTPMAYWSLLYDVPFQYLIANEEMLPPESLRFFHVNMNYVTALLDGSMSVGRLFDVDYDHDKEVIADVIAGAFGVNKSIRAKMLGYVPKNAPLKDAPACASGFLMRSEMVSGWRGLEFSAYDAHGNVLPVLRLDAIGTRVLLGIYQGKISKLEIAQPPEGLHFGISVKLGGGYEKRLRNVETGELYDSLNADVVMHGNRVVDFSATAANISEKLPHISEMTSAFMALEMIQNPFTGIIRENV